LLQKNCHVLSDHTTIIIVFGLVKGQATVYAEGGLRFEGRLFAVVLGLSRIFMQSFSHFFQNQSKYFLF
jgi:hypothetical protein